MIDQRPRLIKTAKPPKPKSAPVQEPKARAVEHRAHRLIKLREFEGWLRRYPDRWERRAEVLPYFRAMIDARRVTSPPISFLRQRWLFTVDSYTAARELFRIAYNQHCPSVVWSPDDWSA